MAILNVSRCFVVRGTLSNGTPFLSREFIWPSCDSPQHRRWIKLLMTQKANRMNRAGADVTVQYQILRDDLWHDANEPAQ